MTLNYTGKPNAKGISNVQSPCGDSAETKNDSPVIAIDSKTVCGVASQFGDSPLHIVSVFCKKNMLTLCQEKVNDKSNEITAIPALKDLLDLKNCIVTIDAMGCRKEIAVKIRDKEGDNILQVKDNHKDLKQKAQKLFKTQTINNEDTKLVTGHGRLEKRLCHVIDNLKFLDGKGDSKDLKTNIETRCEIYQKKTWNKS